MEKLLAKLPERPKEKEGRICCSISLSGQSMQKLYACKLQEVSYPHEALKKLTCPLLCLVGSEDPLNLPAWSRQVAAVLPNAQVVEIPALGHSPYFEDGQTWNRIVLDFLAGVRSPS